MGVMEDRKKRHKKKFHKSRIIWLLVFSVLMVFFGYVYIKVYRGESRDIPIIGKFISKVVHEEDKSLNVLDPDSNARPYAVMINNHPEARKYHSGLQEAYLTYEIIVEGGMTRLMPIYKGVDVGKIGSVRSARHYFLDYAMENDAVYVHWGWSPMAESDIKNLGINNINGLNYEGTYFYRDRSLPVSLEHTGYTDTERIQNGIKKLGYRNTTGKDLLLNYSIDEIDMSKLEGATVANNITINYSSSIVTSYKYDENDKVYYRSVNGAPHKDYVTGNQYYAKNIIVYQISNYTLAGDDKGRQDIDNLGSGDGYLISNGYAVPIQWSKSSRSAQTKYTYLDGKEITVNDGNTYIQIQPKGRSLNIG